MTRRVLPERQRGQADCAVRVQHDGLTARAHTRVDGQHALLTQWGGQQQFTDVLRKDADGAILNPVGGRTVMRG
ncbi:MAG: hypothetical protein LC797_18340 [Chloroflexi bacterium]|nr:hypothetical protein [Chloroflexota bacterium]